MSHARRRTLGVSAIARVEGEGGLQVLIEGDEVADVKLNIYEPPRFFEAFLRGRGYMEPPDITARICGICPVAYQMSACEAIEDVCGATIEPEIQALRRLLYCGEWIESHALHIYMLHAPDFLGYEGALDMARDHKELVERGLRIKRLGNRILEIVGGRSIHPINVKVGGFYQLPNLRELRETRAEIEWALAAAMETVQWVSSFRFPEYEAEWDLVGLTRPDEYAIMGGVVASLDGKLRAPISTYLDHFHEEHVEHSNALHGFYEGGDYVVGPLARFSLNFEQLPDLAKHSAMLAGLGRECRNPFRSIVVRAVELVTACEEAGRIVDEYRGEGPPATDVRPRPGVGHGASEAPRGMLYHRYELDEAGIIVSAMIVPPTAQNLPAIEHDLFHVVEANQQLEDGPLTHLCEHTIRNYDPCISCATHFLDLTVDRR